MGAWLAKSAIGRWRELRELQKPRGGEYSWRCAPQCQLLVASFVPPISAFSLALSFAICGINGWLCISLCHFLSLLEYLVVVVLANGRGFRRTALLTLEIENG